MSNWNVSLRFFSVAWAIVAMASGCEGTLSSVDSDIAPDGSAEKHVVFLDVENETDEEDEGSPLTFAHVFKPRDVPSGHTLGARIDGIEVPLQTDPKARHHDGSLRHAILTLRGPHVPAHGSVQVELITRPEAPTRTSVGLEELLATDFDADVALTIDGRTWTRSARACLERASLEGGTMTRWMEGSEASEWVVSAPLEADGVEHPHLTARFSIRAFAGLERVRVAVVVENDWTYEPNPQNYTYDVRIDVGGVEAFHVEELVQHRQTRWRETFWWGDKPRSRVRHDARYLIETGALPHYDPSLVIPEATLERLQADWASQDTGAMGIGPMEAYMPATGAHADIGPLSRWDALCVVSMDSRACDITMRLADLAGSWPTHFRDHDTDLPVSIVDFPYLGLHGNPGDYVNRETHVSEALPACPNDADCTRSPYTPDDAHQPSLGYLAYVLAGEFDHLEELQLWANYNVVLANPHYRELDRGLLKWQQVRGQAWSLRTLGYAAFITPDNHPMKDYFLELLTNNIEFYTREHVAMEPNALGFMTTSPYLAPYDGGLGIAPWMDDFFTWSVGQLVAMGFEEARPLLEFKARFPVGRMMDPGFCWIFGAPYSMHVRGGEGAGQPFFDSFSQVYQAMVDPAIAALPCGGSEMAAALSLREGEMTGYSSSDAGYPANMQPALAVAVDSGIEHARAAWERFEARSVKPNYTGSPQFAITPRSMR